MSGGDIEVRPVRPEDKEAVVDFTSETWADRGGSDYIPHVFDDWIANDGDGQMTFVLDAGRDVAGICQGVLLSEDEAWAQGMRVNPDYRGRGVSLDLSHAVFDWAAGEGATVCRNMVFSWNIAGLGQSRATGFAPETEFRWAHPDPDPNADPNLPVTNDPTAAWRFWTDSPAREHLAGLGLDMDESWALSEVTRDRLHRAADEQRTFAVHDEGVRGMAYRTRMYERLNEDGDPTTWAEYGAAGWSDVEVARSLFAAIAADAAACDAEKTRVLIPETVWHVSDVAYTRTDISDEPDFVLAADLTDRR
ncbi:GNAT family N-acetyltransferase [Halomarina litorea]|uniref:GNAT family N-acetyltransferase n=1 Tax=Halomarina litorea TaxID=2961595 RepID=UPI0020C2002B|nr:GNAT family N-acetyltransferase [Halomarina sp. BCD28]